MSIFKICFALLHEVVAEWGRHVSDTKLVLAFVRSRYLVGRYIPTTRDTDFDNDFMKEPDEYERSVQRELATDRLVSSADERNILC